MFNQEDISKLNEDILRWNKDDVDAIKNEMYVLGIRHRKRSPNLVPHNRAFKSGVSFQSGIVNRIKFTIPKSMVYVHKGVSRKHPITNPRKAKEWFNPVLERKLPELEEIVADGTGNLIINAIQIK